MVTPKVSAKTINDRADGGAGVGGEGSNHGSNAQRKKKLSEEQVRLAKIKKRMVQKMKPPCHYQHLYSSYFLEWQEAKQSNSMIRNHMDVNDMLVVDNSDGDGNDWLVSVTSLGQVVLIQMQDGDDGEGSIAVDSPSSSDDKKIIVDVSTEPLRTVALYMGTNSNQLIVGGEGGIWMLDLRSGLGNITPTQILSIPNNTIQEIRFAHNNRNPEGPIVLYALTKEDGQILQCTMTTIANDATSNLLRTKVIYKNPMKPVTTFRVQSFPLSDSADDSTFLVIGTSVSEVLWWDVQKQKSVDSISLSKELTPKQQQSLNAHSRHIKLKTNTFVNYTITSLWCSNDQWWTIGGARTTTNKRGSGSTNGNANVGGGGFVCTWHRPTKSMIAAVDTRETIQRLIGMKSNNASSQLYTLGNESILSVWNSPYQLQRTYRISIHSPSGKAIAVASDAKSSSSSLTSSQQPLQNTATHPILCVAGVGCKINIIQEHCCVDTIDA